MLSVWLGSPSGIGPLRPAPEEGRLPVATRRLLRMWQGVPCYSIVISILFTDISRAVGLSYIGEDMAKVDMETVFLVSSAGTGFFYINRKNKRKFKGEGKLKIMKYDPIARKHVLFEEKKLSRLKKKWKPESMVAVSKANA